MSHKPRPERIDEDTPEATDEWFQNARPAHEVLPELFGNSVAQALLQPKPRSRVGRVDLPVTQPFMRTP
jgi:hypothetical protein